MARGIHSSEYLDSIKKRSENTRVGHKHQLIGLEVADLLNDREHASLYIKLVKKYGEGRVVALAKDIAERKNVKNRGAYFMRVFHKKDGESH